MATPIMSDDSKTLDALRREIDTIDDSIHDLLMQRATGGSRPCRTRH